MHVILCSFIVLQVHEILHQKGFVDCGESEFADCVTDSS